jgi:hypothetical protein
MARKKKEEYDELVPHSQVVEIVPENESADRKAIGLFDIINDISSHSNVISELIETEGFPKEYSAFMITKAFGNFYDTILLANEMNLRHWIPNEAHYHFLYNSVYPRKRFSKWYKQTSDENFSHIAKVLNISERVLRLIYKNIPKESIDAILEYKDGQVETKKSASIKTTKKKSKRS